MKVKEFLENNPNWQQFGRMLFRYINTDQPIPVMTNLSDFIRLGYTYNPTVFSIISWRGHAAKGIPWLVYEVKNSQKLRQYTSITQKTDKGLAQALQLKEESLEEVEGSPVNKILYEPNPIMSFADMVEGMFIFRDITGNSYMFAVTNPGTSEIMQLFLMPADKTKIIAGTFYNPIQGYNFEQLKQEIIEPQYVVHWKYFNPIYGEDGRQLYGLSPLIAAARIINNDNTAIDSQTASFANEGVKGVIHGKNNEGQEYKKEQYEGLLKRWKNALLRSKKGEGNVGFSNLELGYIKVGETPVDLGVLDARKYNKEVLCNIFRIHPSLFNSDASTLNNLTEARKALMTMSVLPDMDALRIHINAIVRRFFGERWFVDYDLMAISELQDDIEKLSRTLTPMSWLTENEKRRWMNFDDFPNPLADTLWTSMGKIPMETEITFDEIDEALKKVRSNGLGVHK